MLKSDDRPSQLLIVDDEPTLRLGFSYALTKPGTQVDMAAHGIEALDKCSRKHYDLMVLDLRMPELDGLGVIHSLRQRGIMVPIILCSAYMTFKVVFTAVRAGVVDFLMKPIRPVDLRGAVAAVVEPDLTPLGRALSHARRREFAAAARILNDSSPESSSREGLWASLFKQVDQDVHVNGNDYEICQRSMELLFHVHDG